MLNKIFLISLFSILLMSFASQKPAMAAEGDLVPPRIYEGIEGGRQTSSKIYGNYIFVFFTDKSATKNRWRIEKRNKSDLSMVTGWPKYLQSPTVEYSAGNFVIVGNNMYLVGLKGVYGASIIVYQKRNADTGVVGATREVVCGAYSGASEIITDGTYLYPAGDCGFASFLEKRDLNFNLVAPRFINNSGSNLNYHSLSEDASSVYSFQSYFMSFAGTLFKINKSSFAITSSKPSIPIFFSPVGVEVDNNYVYLSISDIVKRLDKNNFNNIIDIPGASNALVSKITYYNGNFYIYSSKANVSGFPTATQVTKRNASMAISIYEKSDLLSSGRRVVLHNMVVDNSGFYLSGIWTDGVTSIYHPFIEKREYLVSINGSCGTANGTTIPVAPFTLSEKCSAGTPSTISGTGPWTWSCAGSGTGSTAACSAIKTLSSPGIFPFTQFPGLAPGQINASLNKDTYSPNESITVNISVSNIGTWAGIYNIQFANNLAPPSVVFSNLNLAVGATSANVIKTINAPSTPGNYLVNFYHSDYMSSSALAGSLAYTVVSYSCTGTDPFNASMCFGDDTGLTANIAKTLSSSCTAPKCQFTCNAPTYVLSGGVCILADITPPTVSILTPSNTGSYTTDTATINISGTSIDNIGLDYIEWVLNGTVQVPLLANNIVGTSNNWSKNNITLKYGINTIEVRATDDAGLTGSDLINIYYLPPNGELIGYAWTDTIGWISFSSKNNTGPIFYGVVVDPLTNHLSGYGWSENVGWVSFEETTPTPDANAFKSLCYDTNCNSATACTACYNPNPSAVPLGTGRLYGWGKVISLGNDGWIKLRKSLSDPGGNYGIDYNMFSNEFTGYAWNGNTAPSEGAGLGWLSFNCLNDNCLNSNYKVWAQLNFPPSVSFSTATPATELPCGSGVNSTEGACISNCELEPLVTWSYIDPQGFPQEEYRFIFDNDNDLNNGTLIDTGRVVGTLFQVSPSSAPWNIPINYNTTYYAHIETWNNFGLSSGMVSINFTTDKHQYPNPLFTWFTPDPSAQEQIEFTASSTYYMDASGTNTNTPLSPGICQFAGSCSWLWTSTSPGSLSSNNTQSTLATFDSAGNNTMNLVITDSDTYSCATSTNMNINKKLPTWTEVR